jgi:DNA-binding CsgD family transcriptional regulator/tetratricopeptide (TPR) repeat protein
VASDREDIDAIAGGRRRPPVDAIVEWDGPATPTRIVGRSVERAVIDNVLREAREGRGATLLIMGEPGIGKSALLTYALEKAGAARIVSTSGYEPTRTVPFGHLADLVEPLENYVAGLADSSRRVLKTALDEHQADQEADLIEGSSVGVALLELLAEAASQHPLVILVDDAQWLDPSTTAALAFATRRLDAEPIAFVVAVRQGETTPLAEAAAASLTLVGLEEWDVVDLLGPGVDAGVAGELTRATGGNPLALLHAAGTLSDERLQGLRGLEAPIAVGRMLEDTFGARVASLDEPTRLFMLLVAAQGPSEIGTLQAAAASLGIEPSGVQADAMSTGLLVETGTQIKYGHPLMRSAVYHQASLEDRRAVHSALAGVLRRDGDLSRRALHLVAAANGPDEPTAALVESSADAAARQFGFAEAGALYSQAAELSPRLEDKTRRTLAAARVYHLAGNTEPALALIDAAVATATDPAVLGDLLLTRMGLAVVGRRPIGDLGASLVAVAEQIVGVDPVKAALLQATAALPAMAIGRGDLMQTWAARALELAEGTPFAEIAQIVVWLSLLHAGRESEALVPLSQFCVAASETELFPATAMLVPTVAVAVAWGDRNELALAALDRQISVFRTASIAGNLPQLLTNRAWVRFYSGDWPEALADSTAAVALAEEHHQATVAHYARLVVASVGGAQGLESARIEAEIALAGVADVGARGLEAWAHSVLGFIAQGSGRAEQTVRHFLLTEELLAEGGPIHPMMMGGAAELVEGSLHIGDRAAAEQWSEIATARARTSGNFSALAQAARCGGMLASPADFEARFAEALDHHRRSPRPFERARTELCFGERLRRERRLVPAIAHLETAREIFANLEAKPWRLRCDRELEACGVTMSEPAHAWSALLTPQELQVALTVAEGSTNREVAHALFLSPRTVEAHLASVFRKVGVTSRSQLVRQIAEARQPLDE